METLRCPECKSDTILEYQWVPGHMYCPKCGVGHHEASYFRLDLYEDYELWLKEREARKQTFLHALKTVCLSHGFQPEYQRDDISFLAVCDGCDDYNLYFLPAPFDYWYHNVR